MREDLGQVKYARHIETQARLSEADRETIRFAIASRCAKCSGPIGDARAKVCHACEAAL